MDSKFWCIYKNCKLLGFFPEILSKVPSPPYLCPDGPTLLLLPQAGDGRPHGGSWTRAEGPAATGHGPAVDCRLTSEGTKPKHGKKNENPGFLGFKL